MSGIVGVFRRDDAPIDPETMRRMLGALAAYGPDGSDFRVFRSDAGTAALGHLSMRMLPEDVYDRQPLSDASDRIHLVADARVDNRDELRRALGIDRQDAARMPDSAFLLAAWQRWGEECTDRLVGDYAFALWDERRRIFFCARDPLGQRTLFVHRSPELVAVASAPAGLLALGIPRRLNETKVADFLVLLHDPAPTFFEGIEHLPPAHSIRAERAAVRAWRHTDLRPPRRIRLPTDDAYVEAFREVFDTAVRAQTRSIHPVGVMISGGLDSTAAAASAAPILKERGERLTGFHATTSPGFSGPTRPGWVADETDDVLSVAAWHENVDIELIPPDGRTPFDDIESLFRAISAPFKNVVNRPWLEALYERARDRGVRILLNGQKGNATISYSGIFLLRELGRSGRLPALIRETRAFAAVRGQSPRDIITDMVLRPLVPDAVNAFRNRNRQTAPVWVRRHAAIDPDFARRIGIEQRVAEMGYDGDRRYRNDGITHRLAVLAPAPEGPDWYHAGGPRYGIESRDPSADRRVIEFCLAVPESQFLRLGRDRWLLRRALEGRLPPALVQRTTRGQQAADWFDRVDPIRAELAREVGRIEANATASALLDVRKMRALVDDWPATFRIQDQPAYALYLLRGIMMGRFIRWFEETAEGPPA
jgi:asparagine synthase (glutamine-hydrolysing)